MIRVFSYGGGVQSTAALVLAAQKKIDFPIFLFSNVGEDSEHPDTLRYVREIAMPYAEENGIDLLEVSRPGRTLYQELTETDRDLIPWQIRMTKSKDRYGEAMAVSRTCTSDWKIKVLARVQKELGATKEDPAITGLGISLDEMQRMKTDSGIAWQKLVYPLIDLRLDRQDCINIIAGAGLPIPPKSACWFCPHHSLSAWQRMRDEEPELFERAATLEEQKRAARVAGGKEPVYFHRKLQPIIELTAVATDEFDFACESGFCMV